MQEEIDSFIQELEEKVKYLVELKIDKEGEWKEWDVREGVIAKIQYLVEDLKKLREAL